MRILYTIAIHTLYFLILAASLFNRKAKLWISGRKNWRRQFNAVNLNHPVIWFHAASLGEFEQGLPVMEAIKKSIPGCSIAVSFFSPSGFEVRKNSPHADFVFYLPLDTRYNALKLIRQLKPDAVFFIKYEFWHNFLDVISSKGIPAYLLSGIFRQQQAFFKWYGWWFRKDLKTFKHIFVQNELSANLLRMTGTDNVTITGDTRFDRVLSNASRAVDLPIIAEFTQGSVCIVAGSTWPADENILAGYINRAAPNVKFIIAPHEIEQSHIARLVNSINKDLVLYSLAGSVPVKDKQVMIIDNIGLLSSIYRYGRIAYIGGGFGSGIHNLLEAAVYDIPVIFGPNHHKFNEAVELLASGGGFTIAGSDEFGNIMNKLITLDQHYQYAANKAGEYIKANAGATAKVITHVLPGLK